jgi:methylenetetrahydrofolate--tRNA-(uracil-5-)-methyltransferase
LHPTFQTQAREDLFFAGQLTGVEGYVESAAAGLMAGLNAALLLNRSTPVQFPRDTVLGALTHYITTADPKHFQPMNSNWALLAPLEAKVKKGDKPPLLVARAQAAMREFMEQNPLTPNR